MLSEIMHNIYCLPLSTVALIMVLFTPVFGVAIGNLKYKLQKEVQTICLILSALYIFFVLYLTVLGRDSTSMDAPELIPFSVFVRAKDQPELYREVIMNVFLFWPIGLCLPQGIGQLPHTLGIDKHPVLITIVVSCILSIAVETIQYFYALGLVEIDDVIANTLGASIGTISFLISECCLQKFSYN